MNGSTLQKTAADCAEEPVDPHTYGSGTREARERGRRPTPRRRARHGPRAARH